MGNIGENTRTRQGNVEKQRAHADDAGTLGNTRGNQQETTFKSNITKQQEKKVRIY